ncbi:MAG: hypothetical protein HYY63_00045, partial [Elusimicrobia bacterium]|nr:hypothetical protein [Elusimicrobiota bacterium]
MMIRSLGIFREKLHSPERESDDETILRLTAESCSALGMNVVLRWPEEFLNEKELWKNSPPEILFMMCEQEKILEPIQELEQSGVRTVNKPIAVLNTYRDRMLPLVKSSQIPFPESEIIWTRGMDIRRALSSISLPCWIKRGDVHNTQKGDVSLARSAEEIEKCLISFDQRGIQKAVLQKNIRGDLVKFYGIGCGPEREWFRWFYHKNQDLKKFPFSEMALANGTDTAARALGLEIYG